MTYQWANDGNVVVFVHDELLMLDWKVDYEYRLSILELDYLENRTIDETDNFQQDLIR